MLSDAHEALAAVAEYLQAGVVERAEGKGAISDANDLSLGAGLFPKSPLRRYLDAADVVLAVVSRCALAIFQPEQPRFLSLPPPQESAAIPHNPPHPVES